MQIFIDCDHHGESLKRTILAHFTEQNITLQDLDLGIEKPYPHVARNLAQQVLAAPDSRGILICKTGIGMSIVANKHAGIYANNCSSAEECIAFRKANNGNILCLGASLISDEEAIELCQLFIETKFDLLNRPRLELIESIFPLDQSMTVSGTNL